MLAEKLFQSSFQLPWLDGVFPTTKAAPKVRPTVRTLAAIIWPKLLAIWALIEHQLALWKFALA